MTNFFDNLDQILDPKQHATDYDIVRQALSVYITIVTRFEGFFAKEGYSLFLKRVFKMYCTNISSTAITSGIEYTFQRFYQLHGESFLLQGILSETFQATIITKTKTRINDPFLRTSSITDIGASNGRGGPG